MRVDRYHPALVVLHWLLGVLIVLGLFMGTFSLDGSWMRALHAIAAKLLMALVAVHVAAALWHQAVRRDGLLRRMGLGRRR